MKLPTEIRAFKTPEEMKDYVKPIYIIEDYTVSEDDYKVFQEKIYNLIKGCFEHKACREYPVQFKFYRKDKEVHTLQLRHFLVNAFCWYPFINLHGIPDVLDSSFIINCENDIPRVTWYINEKLILTLREYSIKNTVVNQSISEVLYNLRRISIDFSLIMNLTLSSETFLEMYEKNNRLHEMMETKFPLDMQPAEIENQLNSLMKEEIEILKGMPDNPIGIILRAGTGIKPAQLREFTINMGLKPDLTGMTIPLPINSSTIMRGLDKPSSLYLDAMGARKSMVLNKKVMGRAGYFGKIVLLLARTLSLSKTVSDCDTRHYLEIDITSKKMLEKYDGRYYKLDPNDEELHLISAKNKDLIGRKLYLRSPVTCACGDEVCSTCFGTTSLLNFDIADGVVGFEVEEVTKVINQMILSAKHLLTTISTMIKFSEPFDKFFSFYAGEINPILTNSEIENLNDWAIWINPNELQRSDELDDDSSFNTFIENSFYLYNMVTKETIKIESEDDREMFLTDECLELMKKVKGYINFKDMDENTTLFEITIMNNELTKPLYEIINLLNKANKEDKKMTYHEMAQRFTQLLLDANIGATAVSGEVIINRLIRSDPDLNFKRPDFSQKDIGDYQIYTVLKALVNNASPLIGLASQNLRQQLLSDDLVSKKFDSSYIDVFFKKTTKTDRLRKIQYKKRKRC